MPSLTADLSARPVHDVAQRFDQPVANVCDFLLEGKDAARPALIALDQTYSYGQLQSATSAIAAYLCQRGGQKSDRALLLADNSFFWVAAYFGILKAGMVCVPLPPNSSAANLVHIVESTSPRFAFTQEKVATQRSKELAGTALVTNSDLDSIITSTDAKQSLPAVIPSDLAALMFTSGSTGKPRGVMISHGNIIANTESIVEYLSLSADDRIMAVLPMHYCFGASLLHTHLRTGGTVVFDSRFMYPDKVLQRMAETECTGFAGVPSHFQILLRKSSLPRMSFPKLRYVQQAGGHLAPVFVRELAAALSTTEIFLMYGQTEATARLAYLPPGETLRRPGAIGKAIPGVTLRVLDKSNNEILPGEAGEGEIVAEGDNISAGYWHEEAGTSETFRDGQLRTGDIASWDSDGFLHLVDRASDFVKCGGQRVSCQALEEQLLEFDELLEAAVIGIPDEILGEAIKVFVVPRDSSKAGLDQRLMEFCNKTVPKKLAPKSIVVLKALPKNGAGKVLKPALRQL